MLDMILAAAQGVAFEVACQVVDATQTIVNDVVAVVNEAIDWLVSPGLLPSFVRGFIIGVPFGIVSLYFLPTLTMTSSVWLVSAVTGLRTILVITMLYVMDKVELEVVLPMRRAIYAV